ncbi:MAG: preprotein translocase subunit YajC [Elusimicrobiota bacterium]|jgi:preprotein translocase subunit YajC
MGTQTVLPKGSSTNATPTNNPLMSFMPMIVICLILYFLVIRPQQKTAKEHKRMIDNLKTGDRVLTQGGIYGTVTSIKGGIVQLKIAENVRIDVSRSAITQVIKEASNGSPATAVVGEIVS